MNTSHETWINKLNQICLMFPNHARSALESVLISNQGCTEKTANHLIDVESTNLDLSGLIEEEAAVFANVKIEMDWIQNGESNNYDAIHEIFNPFSVQYQLGKEPDRADFLNLYQRFCTEQGYPCQQVPVVDFVNGINFDLYRMYTEVVKLGGFSKISNPDPTSGSPAHFSWKEISLKALRLKTDRRALSKVQALYKKYLLDFEQYYSATRNFSSIDGVGQASTGNGPPPRKKHKKTRKSADSGGNNCACSSSYRDDLPAPDSSKTSVDTIPLVHNLPPNFPSSTPSTSGVFYQQTNGGLTTSHNHDTLLQGVEDSFQEVAGNNEPSSNEDFTEIEDSRNNKNERPVLPEKVLAARKLAQINLTEAIKEQKQSTTIFKLHPIDPTDPEYDRLTDKAKIFFNLFSNSTVEIAEMFRIQCPQNKVNFYEKSSVLVSTSKTVELYRSTRTIPIYEINEERIYRELREDRMFTLYKYAETESVGILTMIVCDALLGEHIDVSDTTGEAPLKISVPYKNQIRLKYVINLTATKIAAARRTNPYSDVPDLLAHMQNGHYQIDVRTFDFRNASDPWLDVVLKATSLYNGDCLKRQTYSSRNWMKKDIACLDIVVAHEIWKKYEAQRQKLHENGGKEVYAYHATSPHNVPSIVENNLDWQRAAVHGRAHGNGCYFSEYPEYTLKYNNHCMFIFKLILLPNKYRRIHPDKQGYCEQIIMWDNSLFKPVYVLYF
ncbi:hypothetical protein ACHWQZ_G006462 [Mnemiopsis leidyi]